METEMYLDIQVYIEVKTFHDGQNITVIRLFIIKVHGKKLIFCSVEYYFIYLGSTCAAESRV